jgi:hypothetical protein
MLTNMPMEPQDTTSSLRLEKSTAQSLDPTNITVEDYKLDSMPVNTSMLVVDSHHHHHQNNNNNNNNNNSNNNNSHRSTTNPHSSVVSSVNTMTIHDEDGNHIHQGSSLITSHSPESSYNNTLASMSSGSSGQMKFALSGRAPRNASFRCEFCGKKYINRAPLVTVSNNRKKILLIVECVNNNYNYIASMGASSKLVVRRTIWATSSTTSTNDGGKYDLILITNGDTIVLINGLRIYTIY